MASILARSVRRDISIVNHGVSETRTHTGNHFLSGICGRSLGVLPSLVAGIVEKQPSPSALGLRHMRIGAPGRGHRKARSIQTFAPTIGLLLSLTAGACLALDLPTHRPYAAPLDLMRKVAQNEVNALNDSGMHLSFRGVKTTAKGSATKLYVETREATAGETIAYNDQPLTAEQRQAEETRIERFINNPDALKKKCAEDRENTDRTLRILRALPDAFQYDYAGEQVGSESIGRLGARLLKLNFRPNPAYQAPSRLEEVLTAMQGFVLIDADQMRLASIDATLFKDVAFGWGVLGHLNRGGRFVIQQQNIADNYWQASRLAFTFSGKLLLMKTISVNSSEVFSEFRLLPPELTLVQTLELMKHQGSVIAANWMAFNVAPKQIRSPGKK